MGAFIQGLNHGFMHGLFDRMFGFPSMFNFNCWYNSPITYSSGYFIRYSNPTVNMNLPLWNFEIPTYNPRYNNFYALDTFEYSLPRLNQTCYDYGNMYGQDFVANNSTKYYFDSFKNTENKLSNSNIVAKNDTEQKSTKLTNICAQDLKNKWSSKIDLEDAFYEKVIKISKDIKCSPEDLMALMSSESAGTFNPAEWNHAGNRAVGLIQFTDIAAKSINTTLEELEKMSALEQLDYVKKYLIYAKTKVAKFDKSHELSAGDLYAITYLPAYAKKNILASKKNDPNEFYAKNRILDIDNDGKITKEDLSQQIIKHRA